MSSLRMRCIEYIAKNGSFLPYQEIASALNEDPQRVRGALGDARADGLLVFGKDDVTGQGGYSITSKGQARINNGNQTVNGKRAEENKAACDAKEAHVMSAPADDLRDVIKRLLIENAALRKDNFDLVGTIDDLRGFSQHTQASLEEAQRELMRGATLADSALMKKPSGYTFVFDDDQFSTYETEAEARQSAEFNLPEISYRKVHLVAVLDTAELAVKWQRS